MAAARFRHWAYIALCTALLVALIGFLTRDPEPQPFSRGQSIPFGRLRVQVTHSSVFQRDVGFFVAAYVTIDGIRNHEDMQRLIPRLTVRTKMLTSEGKEYPCLLLPQRQVDLMTMNVESLRSAGDMRWLKDYLVSSPDLRHWAAVATMPPNSSGVRVLIRNPDPAEGQPEIAVVPLGR